jgi:DNA-binding PadR family transcriptional regulator
VLEALAAEPDRWRYGYDLCTELGVLPGSMYPILIRLADRGLLQTTWEADHVHGRPARHLYRLSSDGREYAAAVVSTHTEQRPASSAPARRPQLGGA